jgi:polysaccharide export outer membrane protein
VNARSPSLLAPLLLALVSGCAHTSAVPPPAAPADYRVGRDDLLAVDVWKEEALSAEVPVRPDGRISLPMVGEVVAEGRTVEELKREIAARLRGAVAEPLVTVMVKEVRASRFFVLGEVAHPGAFPLTGGITILEAVTVAGGPTEFAHPRRVVVMRRARGARRPERIPVDFGAVLSGKSEPLAISPGDTVYVP